MEGAIEVCGPVGVVLFQLGGPDSLEAVEPFLNHLFSDPDIIDFPFARLARPAMARLIASRRAAKVREHYARIGGKSPLRELTERQAAALERELRKVLDARVLVAMRYWHPLTEVAVRQIVEMKSRYLVLLPLYPQYSRTTTGSSMNVWKRQYARAGQNHIETHIVHSFHDEPAYLDALIEKIDQGLRRFDVAETRNAKTETRNSKLETRPPEDVHLVFSAHGVPQAVIEAGDPYQKQIEETVRLAMARGGWPNPCHLCYQSRVGPGRWLGPTLDQTIRRLAAAHSHEGHSRASGDPPLKPGVAGGQCHSRASGNPTSPVRLLIVPISFVSDHVETLAEIDLEARALAQELGVGQFELMPALNDSPQFIRALAELVLARVGASDSPPVEGQRAG
ncbi:MAG: ferrochelatase [Acidobacteria bacterium]|nr:MAG: ferrochelatase [Acidobacteriota bacterium]